jgi:hypothetical protein
MSPERSIFDQILSSNISLKAHFDLFLALKVRVTEYIRCIE